MIAFLIYLSTVAHVPHMLMAVGALLLIIREYDRLSSIRFTDLYTRRMIGNALLVSAVIVVSAFNWSFHLDKAPTLNEAFPTFLLLPVCILAGAFLRKGDAKWLLHLIALESIVALVEYSLGMPSIVPGVDVPEISPGQANMWYYQRVYGLSINSSVLALKVFTALLLMDYFKLRSSLFKFYRLLFFAAIFVTFNRTVILTVAIYLAGQQVQSWYVVKAPAKRQLATMFGVLMVLLVGGVGIYLFSDQLLSQFTRDKGVDLSGRDHIWPFFWDYILNHMFFGNGGMKVLDPLGRHAHNSMLQNWATNGGIATLLLVWLILRNIGTKNFWLVVAILIYSGTQYGIFWGISLMDMALYTFLFRREYMRLLDPEQRRQAPPAWTGLSGA